MDINDIQTGFTDETEPQDEHLTELLKQAYTGKILCTMAVADLAVIQPFSDYQPKISEKYRIHFKQQAQDNVPPSLYVYAKDGKLIMSDDYASFALYKELGFPKAVCTVIGETPEIEGVVYHGTPFELPPLTVEEL